MDLKELLEDHQLYHSKFQQDYFITIESGGTIYGQYKQALREVYKRVRGLRESYFDKEKLLIEIEEQKELSCPNRGEYGFKAKYADIEYRRKAAQLEECLRVIKDTEREFKRFYRQAVSLKEQVGNLTDSKRNDLEKEMFIYKLKRMMVTDLMCQGRYSPQTHNLLMSLPLKDRKAVIEDTGKDKQDSLIDEIYDADDNHFDKLEEIDIDIKQCLLEI